MTRKIPPADNAKDAKLAVPLKYLSNFQRTLEMSLVNCEVNFILTCSTNRVISSPSGETKFAITLYCGHKIYVPVVT